MWWMKLAGPNHQALFGEIQDKKALDVACGEGLHARYLLEKGASKVVGVDISEVQIQAAKSKDPLGAIEWICADVATMGKIDEFDIISAAYLLHYAKNRQELLDMCKQIKSNLAVNGKFFGSIGRVPKNKDLYKTHNLTFTCEENDGAPATLDVRLGEVDFQSVFF